MIKYIMVFMCVIRDRKWLPVQNKLREKYKSIIHLSQAWPIQQTTDANIYNVMGIDICHQEAST